MYAETAGGYSSTSPGKGYVYIISVEKKKKGIQLYVST